VNHKGIPTHKVKVFATSAKPYDELYMSVFIQGPQFEKKMFAEMFCKARCHLASTIEDADLVVFTGGSDVNPGLYGEEAHTTTHYNNIRDEADLKAWKQCFEEGIPVFGVCRGMQFLWVVQGGSLYQDVDLHQGNHHIYDVLEERAVTNVSSVHHQMIDPKSINPARFEIVATNNKATRRHLNSKTTIEGELHDVEAVFMRDTAFFGVQGHPEYRGYEEFLRWTLKKMVHFYSENPDICGVKNSNNTSVWRLRPELLEQREQKTWDQFINSEELV